MVFIFGLVGIFLFDNNYSKIKNPIPGNSLESLDYNLTFQKFLTGLNQNFHHPLNLLLMQILLVLITARILTVFLRKIGQPSVIAEIVAGLALGPSFLGYFFPEASLFLFPNSSLGNLQIISQFGLIVFMFVVGMELDISVLKDKIQSAILISHSSIIIPFISGTSLAVYFFDKYAPNNISFLAFSLFLGIAMSITAFPVLVRIIQEKNLMKTQVGVISITCAAIDDISAWTILAIILAVIQGGSINIIGFIGILGSTYIISMIFIIRPILEKISKFYVTKEIISRGVLSALIILMLVSAMISETLGIHALFGAFLAGVIMPTNTRLRGILTEKLEDFSAIFLLPLFFAFTGIRTQVQLLNKPELYFDFFLVVLIASAGKILGSLFSAKISGNSWRDSTMIGILMNTRGLMELVVLNIGYDMGILSDEIFTMFVLMALGTTLITSPLIGLFRIKITDEKVPLKEVQVSRVLIPFGPPDAGFKLLNLAQHIYHKNIVYIGLHLSPFSEKISLIPTNDKQSEFFDPILTLAKEKELKINLIHRHTDDVTRELKNFLISEPVDMVIMGAAKTIFGENLVGGKVDSILNENLTRIGIFQDRGLKDLNSVVIFYQLPEEADIIFEISGLLQKNSNSDITLVYERGNQPAEEKLRKYFQKGIRIISTDRQSKKVITKYSLVIIGYKHWIEPDNNLRDTFQNDKEGFSSLLILKELN